MSELKHKLKILKSLSRDFILKQSILCVRGSIASSFFFPSDLYWLFVWDHSSEQRGREGGGSWGRAAPTPTPAPLRLETGTFQVTSVLFWPFKPRPLKMHYYSWLSLCNLWNICIGALCRLQKTSHTPGHWTLCSTAAFHMEWLLMFAKCVTRNAELRIIALTQDSVVWFGLVCWLLLLLPVWAGCWPSVRHTPAHIALGISERYTTRANEKSVGGMSRERRSRGQTWRFRGGRKKHRKRKEWERRRRVKLRLLGKYWHLRCRALLFFMVSSGNY